MIDITYVVILVILLLFAIAGKVLAPLIKANVSAKDRETIKFWTEIAVKAAEQLAKTGVIPREEREQHVIDFLTKHNITVDLELVKEVMEACVNDLPSMLTNEEKKKIQGDCATLSYGEAVTGAVPIAPCVAVPHEPKQKLNGGNSETTEFNY